MKNSPKEIDKKLHKTNKKENIPEFYMINNVNYVNPSYLNKNINTRVIDPWPAHSNSFLQSPRHIVISNKHRVISQEEYESRFPNLSKKPKLLEFIEANIQHQLSKHKIMEIKPSPLRLQIYSEAFDTLLQALKSYKPLLVTIKREYEIYIDYLKDELLNMQPLKDLVWTISQEYDVSILKTRNEKKQDIVVLKEEIRNLLKTISDLNADKETLRYQIINLQEELEKMSLKHQTEVDGRKLLITDVHNLESKIKDMESFIRAPEEEKKEDPVKLRWAYDQAKVKLVEANKRILDLESGYNSVLPKVKYDECYSELMAVKEQLNELSIDNKILKKELDESQYQCDTIGIQRDYLYLQIRKLRNRLMSPTPISKHERATLVKNHIKLRETLPEEINKWKELASKLSQHELVSRIKDELIKTDGSAEIVMEVLMGPYLNPDTNVPLSVMEMDDYSHTDSIDD